MAKRDPEKRLRNMKIDELSKNLKGMLPKVLKLTGHRSEQSLHGVLGGKHAQFIDIKNEVIHTPEHFISLWLEGYKKYLKKIEIDMDNSAYYKMYAHFKGYKLFREYTYLFLYRTYLRYYESLAKRRPKIE
ncbi:unnamed protein product, partial [marine sediment metagenome]